MIDYVFAVVVGLLAAAATGYAYRAAKAAEEVVKKIREWEEAWRQYYAVYAVEVQRPESSQKVEKSISQREPEVEILHDEEEKEDYVTQLLKRVSCAAELMKQRGGCAPVDEVMHECGIPKHQLRALFNLKDAKNEVCLRGA